MTIPRLDLIGEADEPTQDIVVSEGMIEAGIKAFDECGRYLSEDEATEIYTAMEKQRRKEAE